MIPAPKRATLRNNIAKKSADTLGAAHEIVLLLANLGFEQRRYAIATACDFLMIDPLKLDSRAIQ